MYRIICTVHIYLILLLGDGNQFLIMYIYVRCCFIAWQLFNS